MLNYIYSRYGGDDELNELPLFDASIYVFQIHERLPPGVPEGDGTGWFIGIVLSIS